MKLKDKILSKLDLMHQYLDELQDILPQDVEEYIQNMTQRRACEKTIELAIETVIDIASIIISEERLRVPQSEEDIFNLLEKKKILSKSLIQKVRQMKGFRNILVHKYGDVEDERAYAYLEHERNDFALFEKEIKQFLKRK